MALPLWISILVTFISGAFAGVIAPIIASKLHKKRWNEQKEFELKYYAFEKAIRAISSWEAEALDPNYQSERQEYKGSIRKMNCSIKTGQELASSGGLIQIWFSEEVYKHYDTLLRTEISIENIPNMEFDEAKFTFINAVSVELQLK